MMCRDTSAMAHVREWQPYTVENLQPAQEQVSAPIPLKQVIRCQGEVHLVMTSLPRVVGYVTQQHPGH